MDVKKINVKRIENKHYGPGYGVFYSEFIVISIHHLSQKMSDGKRQFFF